MASQTATFFIRATKDVGNTNAYHEKSIDLGAYVNALDKSILKIKSVEVAYSDNTGASNTVAANSTGVAQYQLTTQSQTALVLASDRSVISTGRISAVNTHPASSIGGINTHDLDVGPHGWSDGFLVGVDTIFLGGSASTAFSGDVYISIILECEVVTMTQSRAMALALSQQ